MVSDRAWRRTIWEMDTSPRSRRWLHLPTHWPAIAGGLVAALLVVGLVPPARRLATIVTSKIILFVASPFTPSTANFEDLPKASRVRAADGSDLGALGAGAPVQPVPLFMVPVRVRQAVLAAEDAEFYHHAGVDPAAVVRAALFNLAGRPTQGGSTITQQLAKLNYTDSRRTFLRKLRELLYAAKLERTYSKDQLLERYLNQIDFGYNTYGIAAASGVFFGVPPEKLDAAQSATLAGKIRSPEGLDPLRRPDAVTNRRNQVLDNMRRHHWLDDAGLAHARAEPLKVLPTAANVAGGARAPHFLSYVGREAASLDALGGTAVGRSKQAYSGGLTVDTTFDVKAFDAATAATRQVLGAPGDPTTAIVSVQPGDGAVRMLFGGLDNTRGFDVASQGRRQPGSSFKPFLYLAALDAGIDPRSTFDSGSPKTVNCNGGPWTVRNFEGEGGGPRDVDSSLADSVNAVFAQLMGKVGPPAMQKLAEKDGIAHGEVSPAECAMALGGLRVGVSPLEQAAAFATFAARGVYAPPYAVTRITDRNGHVLYTHQRKTSQAFDRTKVAVMNGAMKRVVAEGTGRAAAIGRPVAGKTGTTENFGNAWFIGYVPQLATAVWVGHPEGDVPMKGVHGVNVAGGTFPARIFGQYMRAALAGLPATEIDTASPDDLHLRVQGSTTITTPPSTTTTASSTTVPAEPSPQPVVPYPYPVPNPFPTPIRDPGYGGGRVTTTTSRGAPPATTTTTGSPGPVAPP